jgi:hypothetical protein
MKFNNHMLTGAAMVLAFGAVACSSDLAGPPALDDAQIDADIAANSGAAVVSQIAGFSDDVVAAGSFTMISPSFNVKAPGANSAGQSSVGISPTCSYAAGRYTCAATTEQGLTVSRSFAFYNAQGNTVQTYDAATVESVNFQAQIDGNFQRDIVWSAGVHRTRNVTVSGLISMSPQRKWNGTGTGADTVMHIGLDGIRSLAGTATETVSNVVMPGKDAASQIPLSGSISLAVAYTASLQGVTASVSKEVSRTIVVTFNGTQTATLQIGTLTCQLHLDTASVDSCQ